MQQSSTVRFLPLILVISGLLAYSGSFDGPFVYDDLEAIPENETLSSFAASLSPPRDTTVAGRPVLSASLWLNHALGGLETFGYHALNLAIHVAASLLLFGVVRRVLASERFSTATRERASALAFGVAAIWLLHPLQTQSVTYVVQRAESLMGLFFLTTVYASLRSFEGPGAGRWRLLAILACALGMGTKENMVGAPLIVLALDWTLRPGGLGQKLREGRLLYGGLFATWLVLAAFVAATPRSKSVGFDMQVSAWEYLLTQSGVLMHYLRLSIFPHPQTFDYYDWPIARGVGEVIVPLLSVSALFVLSLWGLVRRHPAGLAGVLFFVVLAPTSSVVPIVTEIAAEHRMYLPLIGVAALVVVGLHELLARRGLGSVGIWIAVGLAVVLAFLTQTRNHVYDSALALWQDAVDIRPGNARARTNLGLSLLQQDRQQEALTHCAMAAELDPGGRSVHLNLGTLLNALGRFDEAQVALRTSVEKFPEDAMSWSQLGAALAQLGRHDDALEALERAYELDPKAGGVQSNLAALHLMRGDFAESVRWGRGAVEQDPEDVLAQFNLGEALVGEGLAQEALGPFRRACQLDPENPRRHRKLAEAQMQAGQLDQAAVSYRALLKLEFEPEDANLLARILATHPDASVRDGAEAVAIAERMVNESGSEDPVLLDTLGTAYAEAGRFEDAIRAAERALRAPLPEGLEALGPQIQNRLELYQQGKAYHL